MSKSKLLALLVIQVDSDFVQQRVTDEAAAWLMGGPGTKGNMNGGKDIYSNDCVQVPYPNPGCLPWLVNHQS